MSLQSVRNSVTESMAGIILPCGLVMLLTGMFWVGAHSLFPKIYSFGVALPTLVLILAQPTIVRSVLRSPTIALFLTFSVFLLISLAWASPEVSGASLATRPFLVLLLFIAIREVGLRYPDRFDRAIQVSVAIAVLSAIYTLARFVMEGAVGRLSGYGALYNPLLVSHVFGFFAALCAGFYFSDRRLFLPLPLIATLLLAVLLLATGSRTPLMAFTATLLWLAMLRLDRKAVICVGILIGIGVVVIALWPDILLQRGASYRPQIWTEALRQIAENPWFGHGFNTPIYIQLSDIGYPFREPHNLVLAVIYSVGIIGGAIWLLMYGVALGSAWRARGQAGIIVYSAPVVYGFVAGLTEGGAFLSRPKEHWFLIWIPLALLALAIDRGSRDKKTC
jgi:O-antigen ligase